jgi:hypothetical protein
VKQKQRYRRKRKGSGLISRWPEGRPRPDEVAARASYVGSGEHKARPVDESYDFDADLRSDASRCDPTITRETAESALRVAIANGSVSADFQGDFPSYVWGWIGKRPHVARLINSEAGHYKGWPIGDEELPLDREGRLTPTEAPDDA